MEKENKIGTIIAIIGFILGTVILDTLYAVVFKHSPLIKIKEEIKKTDSWIDKGLFIDTFYCIDEKEKITIYQEFKGSKFTCPKVPKEEITITKIIDKTLEDNDSSYAMALEKFYEDDKYIYYFECIKSNQVVVIYSNSKEEPVSEALKNKKITIEDLDEYKISYIKQEKDIK